MPSIEAHIAAGRGAGRRLLLEQASITIGRAPECTVPIDLPFVSRLHAELRFEDGKWWLINHSPNGTKLGRRWVTDRPRELNGPAAITIGDQRVMQVTPHVELPAAAHDDDEDDHAPAPPPGQAPGTGLTRRMKLWIGIGIYLVLMLALMLFFMTLSETEPANDPQDAAAQLSPEQIADIIRAEPPKQTPDPRRAREALEDADEWFALIGVDEQALFRAHQSYRRALSYIPEDQFENGLHQRRYMDTQGQLIEQTSERYQQAYSLLRSRQYERAFSAFGHLTEHVYPDPQSPIFRNAQEHRVAARRAIEQ